MSYNIILLNSRQESPDPAILLKLKCTQYKLCVCIQINEKLTDLKADRSVKITQG